MGPTRTIAATTLRLSRRELGATLGVSERAVTAGLLIALAAAAGFGTLLALVSGVDASPLAAHPEGLAAVMRTALAAAILTSTLVAVVTSLMTPDATSLGHLVAMLPVGRRTAVLGVRAPSLVIAALFALVLTAPSFRIVAEGSPSLLRAVTAVSTLSLVVVVSILGATAVVNVLAAGLGRLHLPRRYAMAGAAAASICLAVGIVSRDLIPGRDFLRASLVVSTPTDLLPQRTAARLLVAADPVDLVLASAAAVSICAGFVASLQLRAPRGGTDTTRLLSRAAFPSGRFAAQLWLEILVLIRSPQTTFAALVVVPALVLLRWIAPLFLPGFVVAALAGGLIVVPFFVGLQSVGRTRHHLWIADQVAAGHNHWIGAKALACLIVPGLLAVVSLIGLVALRIDWSGDVVTLLGRVLLAWLSVQLVGAAIPYSSEQSVSASASAITAALLYLATSTATGLILTQVGRTGWLLSLLAMAVVLSGALVVRMRDLGARPVLSTR